MRQRRGPGGGKTVSLDRVTLTSRRLGLTGRPDRLIKADKTIIPEEWTTTTAIRTDTCTSRLIESSIHNYTYLRTPSLSAG